MKRGYRLSLITLSLLTVIYAAGYAALRTCYSYDIIHRRQPLVYVATWRTGKAAGFLNWIYTPAAKVESRFGKDIIVGVEIWKFGALDLMEFARSRNAGAFP
jgi:hypothetical protein